MPSDIEVLALIPARGGSKTLPDKNIRIFGGKPLIAHSIMHALESQSIDRVIVSTDSEKYAEIAQEYGAEAPFIRPSQIAGDHSTDLEVFQHALDWLMQNEGYEPDICVHLRPTYPNRRVEDVDAIVATLLSNPDLDSIRSVSESPETPFKMWFRQDGGLLSPVCDLTEIPEAHSLPRQILPTAYLQNAATDAIRTKTITSLGSMTGKKVYGYVMEENHDIDNLEQFEAAENANIQRQD